MSVDRQINPEPDYEHRFLLVQAEALARAGRSPWEIEHALRRMSAYAESASTRLAAPRRLAARLRHPSRGSGRGSARGVVAEGAISLEPETGRP